MAEVGVGVVVQHGGDGRSVQAGGEGVPFVGGAGLGGRKRGRDDEYDGNCGVMERHKETERERDDKYDGNY